jgi:uncharacterized protein
MSPDDEHLWASLAQALAIPFGFLAPLVIMIVQGPKSHYVRGASVESLNFQLTVLIASVISAILVIVLIGIVMLLAVAVLDLVFCILAAIACSRGEAYRYPFSLRMVH